jgi:hypothetical protein
MDQDAKTDLDQAEQEILNPTLSDEALEAAAGTGREVISLMSWRAGWSGCLPC